MRKTFLAMALALSLLLLGGGQALAATTRVVDDDGLATPNNCDATTPASPTIQGAVDVAGPGDTIKVCPGTYNEQVKISGSGKNNITLTSTTRRAAVIKAPVVEDPSAPDIVNVNGARGVSINRFTISGPFTVDSCSQFELITGVRIEGNGQATLTDNRITEIRNVNPALRGCQDGFGVGIGGRFANQVGDASLFLNQIDKYQKGGVYADNEGTDLNMTGNAVLGDGPNNLIAQNGVQVSRGADAFIGANLVQDNSYIGNGSGLPGTEPGQAAGFILFRDAGDPQSDIRMSSNLVRRNDTNIALLNIDNSVFQNNRALDAPFFEGIYADTGSMGNRFEDNRAFGNKEFDCQDQSSGHGTAGTANTWKNNAGQKSDPPPICKSGKRNHDDDDWDN